MKYLLFNVVVVAALVYLFVGGGPTAPVKAWLPENVSEVIADVRERLPSPAGGDVPVAATAPTPQNRPTETVATPEPVAKADFPVANPVPMPPVKSRPSQIALIGSTSGASESAADLATSQPADLNPPAIDVPERFAPPVILPESDTARLSHKSAPAIEPVPQVDGPLMSPRERRRELQRLAESMELFAVGKTSQ